MESVVDKELDLYVLNSESGSNRVLEGIDTENNLVKNLDSSNVEKILDKDLEVINTESSSDFFFLPVQILFQSNANNVFSANRQTICLVYVMLPQFLKLRS